MRKKNNINICRFFPVLLAWLILPATGWSQLPLHPDRGLVAEASGDFRGSGSLPETVHIRKIEFSWREFEKKEGKFDFRFLNSELKRVSELGGKTVIQVNTDQHPDYIFERVPYLEGVNLLGLGDHANGFGPPMYWDDIYMESFKGMITALADYIASSPLRGSVLAVIPDFRATCDEPFFLPEDCRDSSLWRMPKGVDRQKVRSWTSQTAARHLAWVIELYIGKLGDLKDVPLCIPASFLLQYGWTGAMMEGMESGKLWLYNPCHGTQPENYRTEEQASVFAEYCRKGKTYGFMECLSVDSMTTPWFTYWAILNSLQGGATFLALPEKVILDSLNTAGFEFFQKYTGYCAHPAESPGAWIAFREGDFQVGDYAFHMERNRILESKALHHVGSEKYGLWARQIDSMSTLRIKIEPDFISSLDPGLKLTIRVWYLDDDRSEFRIHAFGGIHTFWKTGSGTWKRAEIIRRPKIYSEILDVVALDGPLTLHMVEITKETD